MTFICLFYSSFLFPQLIFFCLAFFYFSFVFSLILLHLGFANQRRQIAEDQRPGNPRRTRRESAGEQPQNPILVNSIPHTLPKRIPKPQKRHCCPGTRPFGIRFVQADRTENRATYHQKYHDPPRHEFRFIHQNLHGGTEESTGHKCFDIVHFSAPL